MNRRPTQSIVVKVSNLLQNCVSLIILSQPPWPFSVPPTHFDYTRHRVCRLNSFSLEIVYFLFCLAYDYSSLIFTCLCHRTFSWIHSSVKICLSHKSLGIYTFLLQPYHSFSFKHTHVLKVYHLSFMRGGRNLCMLMSCHQCSTG